MNTGQMLLTLAAIFLLSMVILNINRGLFWTGASMTNNRISILAISVGTSVIEKAGGLAFDEKTTTGAQTSPGTLTPVISLGIDANEYASDPTTFDDFDDFNYYNKTRPKLDTIKLDIPGVNRSIIFRTICKVSYVRFSNPDQDTTAQTWYKKLSVKVFSKDLVSPSNVEDSVFVLDTIRLSTVYGYWYMFDN